MKSWVKYAAYLLWVVGLILLSRMAFHYDVLLKFRDAGATPFLVEYRSMWLNFTVPFLFGLYSSILFIRTWSIEANVPLLLCICLPTFLLSIWTPLEWMTNRHAPYWVAITFMFNVPQFISGFTLIYGLFSSKPKP